jgi:hypothetical protein
MEVSMSDHQHPSRSLATDTGPDQLAVFRGRRFRVLPGQAGRSDPSRPGPLTGDPDELVFELRRLGERGERISVRQCGVAEAGIELDHLRAWARAKGCELELGSPLPRPAGDRLPRL